MKKVIVLLIVQIAAFMQPSRAFTITNQQLQSEDSLNYQMIDSRIKELEDVIHSSNHLKSGISDSNLADSTRLYRFNTFGDSVLQERTLFTYDFAGRIKTEQQYKWNEFVKRWLDFNYENSYNQSGKIAMKNYNGWYIDLYQGDMYINRTGVHFKDTIIASPKMNIFYFVYNKFGQPTNFWRFALDQYNILVGTPYSCDYDSEGNKTIVTGNFTSYYNNNLYIHDSYKEEYTYDSEKRVATVIESRSYQYNYVPLWFCLSKIKHEYSYNSDNRVSNIQSYYFSYNANEWRNVSKVDYSYQSNGNLDSRLYSIIDTMRHELMPANRTDFKYSNNKIQLREDYAWNKTTSQWEIGKRLYYYYNYSDPKDKLVESSLTSEIPFRIFPNPAKDMLWIENTGNFASPVHIFNSNGQCVKTDRIEKGMNTISLIQMPKGIYFITIPVINELKSSKLIVE